MHMLETHTFRAGGFPWRLYAGVDALHQLGDEVRRQKAQRAFVVCGQTVAQRTNLLQRVKDQLGDLYAGVRRLTVNGLRSDHAHDALLLERAMHGF